MGLASLALAGPALLAGAAYFDARTHLSYDLTLLRGLVGAEANAAIQAKRDRSNLFYSLETHAFSKASANRPFLVYQGRQWTYKEVYDIVLKYGTWLKARYGVAKGEVVAMDFMNGPLFMFLWFGIWSIGAMPAFINYNQTGNVLLHSVNSSGARILFVDEELRSQFSHDVKDTLKSPVAGDGKGPVETVLFTPEVEADVMSTQGIREPDASRDGPQGSDMAILIFTSGTTGMPKPAIVSWQKCRRSGWFMSSWIGLRKSDRYYTCMPLYHSSGTLLAVCPTLMLGSTLVLGRRFSTMTFWKEVRQHEATIIQYVGETLRYLLAAPPEFDLLTGESLDKKHKVRIAFGNGLRPDVWERFKTRFGIETIAEFYGATEGPSATFNLSANTFTSGAIGRNGALTSWLMAKQYAVVEVDWSTESPARNTPSKDGQHTFCTLVQPGEVGELLFHLDAASPYRIYQGYYGNAQATEGKLLRDVFKPGDIFFRSGDVVRKDSEGRWWFVDRIGDTFRWKSENVSTAEVAEAMGSFPRLLEANVYGVELPHHDGRAGCAAVELHGDVSASEEAVLMKDLADHVQKRLPRYAVPIFLRVVKQMDRTGTNKQLKSVLRNEGVEPGKLGEGESLWWLKGGTYVPFGEREWEMLNGGGVKL